MPDYPIRRDSAHGIPRPESEFTRGCASCGACFLQLAAGKTGERGLWDGWRWYCSLECAPADLRRRALEPPDDPRFDDSAHHEHIAVMAEEGTDG